MFMSGYTELFHVFVQADVDMGVHEFIRVKVLVWEDVHVLVHIYVHADVVVPAHADIDISVCGDVHIHVYVKVDL
jgi:hypothetical protein